MTPPIQYVLGFLFDKDCENVVLIRKARPKWQRGLLNGVGGKAHTGEALIDAMRREFQEEATAQVARWFPFASLRGPGWEVRCFYAVALEDLRVETTDPSEPIEVVSLAGLAVRTDTLDNVPWLAFAARSDWWADPCPTGIEVWYPAGEEEE